MPHRREALQKGEALLGETPAKQKTAVHAPRWKKKVEEQMKEVEECGAIASGLEVAEAGK